MITREELEGRWNQVTGRLRERWGDLTEDELQQARGNTEQLVGVIQRKTGESRRAIEDFLDEVVAGGSAAMERAAQRAREYGEQASEAFQEGYDQVAAGMRTGYAQAQEMVRRNPMESVLTCFGAGIVTGIVLGLVLRSR